MVTHARIPFSDLVFLDENPRTRTPEGLRRMADDIQADPTFFDNRPVLVNLTGGRHQVYAGDLRAHAAHDVLGWVDIPCNIETDVPDATMRRRAIQDNTHREGWDAQILQDSWLDIDLQGLGLDAGAWGGDADEQPAPTATEDYYEPPAEIITDIVSGDLFEIGPHRLLCGDSTSSDDVGRLMGAEKADIEILDPLFDINYSEIATTLPGVICVFTRGAKAFRFLSDISDAGYGYHNLVNLTPANGVAEETLPANTHELVHILRKEKYFDHSHALNFCKTDGSLRATSVMNFGRPTTGENYFKYSKPIGELSYLFAYCKKQALCLDLFLGSGTTMVAAHQLNRRCYGIEIEPKYCQVIIDRMRKLDPSLPITINGKPYKGA